MVVTCALCVPCVCARSCNSPSYWGLAVPLFYGSRTQSTTGERSQYCGIMSHRLKKLPCKTG